jgi:hypothetical protein
MRSPERAPITNETREAAPRAGVTITGISTVNNLSPEVGPGRAGTDGDRPTRTDGDPQPTPARGTTITAPGREQTAGSHQAGISLSISRRAAASAA